MFNDMLKDVIKQLIMLHQNNIPFSLKERDIMLPVNAGQIITIPGVRRSGKSSEMKLVINELVKTGVSPQNILWMGFDDERLSEMSRSELNEILDAYRELYPDTPLKDVYMFLMKYRILTVGSCLLCVSSKAIASTST